MGYPLDYLGLSLALWGICTEHILPQPRSQRDGENDLKRCRGVATIVYYGKL